MSEPTTYTPLTWAKALLGRIGAPDTPADESAIVGWEAAEGGQWRNTARFNPINTTQREPGSTPMNSVGVQAYTSWAQGLDATVTTLENGLYAPILAALQMGSSAPAVDAAVAASPWGTHHLAPAPISGGYATLSSAGPAGSSAGGGAVASPPPADPTAAASGGCSAPSGLSAIVNAPGWVGYLICRLEADAKPALFEVAAVLAGTGLVVAGLWRSVSRSQTFQTAKSNAAKGAEIGALA